MSNIDAAVISLKMKMMERPTIYEVCRFILVAMALLITIGVHIQRPRVAFAGYFGAESGCKGAS